MKHITLFSVIAILLISCPFVTPEPGESDPNAINTAALQTAQAGIVQIMTASAPPATSTPTSSPTLTQFPTLTPSLTPTPFPEDVEALLLGKCNDPWQNAFVVNVAPMAAAHYGDKGCKLPTFSANRKYLAYVTLVEDNDSRYVDTVRVLQPGTQVDRVVHFSHSMNFVSNLEWTPTGQLIIWENIWEGPWVVFVYDPTSDSIISTMRLNFDSELEWNSTRTALYAEHSYSYGATACIHELRGYDFAHSNPFPDFYNIFDIEKQDRDFFGIPNGKKDDIAVEPFAWSRDGKYLWITVKLLHQPENERYFYEVGPQQAGVLEFAEGAVVFTLLASEPNFDYSFEGLPVPTIISSPYRPQRCPSG